jgi:hypothetical protein
MTATFETDKDLEEERLAAKEVGEIWGVIFVKNKKFHPIDWHILKNGMYYGSAEFKRRYRLSTEYSTVFISQPKFEALYAAARRKGYSYFIVRFDDGIFYIDIMNIPLDKGFKLKGRTDRKGIAPNDIEPILEIPMSRMVKLCKHEFTLLSNPPSCAKCGVMAND